MNIEKLKDKKLGKFLGMGLILLAPFFLFDQNIALVDVLPDAVAYIILTLSLRYFRDISSHFETAFKKFRVLVPVSIIKIASLFWIFGGIGANDEREMMFLLVSFCFSVVELIYGIPAWISLFEGFVYHAQSAGGEVPLKTTFSKKARGTRASHLGNVTTSLKDYTIFFLIAKAVLANVCEFAVLSNHTYDDTTFNWYGFLGLFRTLSVMLGFVLGTLWLVRMLRYIIALRRDVAFFDTAREKYRAEVLPKTGLFVTRDIAFLLIILCVGMLLSADFYVDRANAIPDVLCAVAFLFLFLRLKTYTKRYIVGTVLSVVYGAFTVIGTSMAYNFRYENSEGLVWKNPNVFAEFLRMYPVRVIENLLFAALVVVALLSIRVVIRAHCGYVPKTMDEQYIKTRLHALHRELDIKVWICLSLSVLSAIGSGLYELMITFPNEMIGQVWWMVAFALSLVAFASAVGMSGAINTEVESRYMLD